METYFISVAMGMSGSLFGLIIIGAFLFLVRYLLEKFGQIAIAKKFIAGLLISVFGFLLGFNMFSPSNTFKVQAGRKANPVVESTPKEIKEFSLQEKAVEDKERQEKFDSLTNGWREKYNQPN